MLGQLKRNDWIYLSYVLYAVLLPFGNTPVTLAGGLIVLCWLLNTEWEVKLENLRRQKWSMLFVVFYLLYVAGVLYSGDKPNGLFKIGQKVNLFLLPLVIFSLPILNPKLLRTTMNAFLLTCVLVILIDEGRALMRFSMNDNKDMFMYTDFAANIHPIYIACMLNIALAYCLMRILEVKKEVTVVLFLYYAAMVLLLTGIAQLASKAGILSVIIVAACFTFYFIRQPQLIRIKAIVACGILLMLFTAGVALLKGELRMQAMTTSIEQTQQEPIQRTTTESSQERILVWRSSLQLVKEKPLTGYGTGNGSNMLVEKNLENGYTGAYEKKLNAHNQFLQIPLDIGLPGLLVFAALLVIMAYTALKENNYLGYCFVALMVFNMMVESMLEVRNGIAIFSFFSSLFFCYIAKNGQDNKTSPKNTLE